jgi:hypothetical protein
MYIPNPETTQASRLDLTPKGKASMIGFKPTASYDLHGRVSLEAKQLVEKWRLSDSLEEALKCGEVYPFQGSVWPKRR